MMEPATHGRRFTAELDMCDIDDRLRPGPVWTARSVSISRSRLWIRSRRMSYVGTRVATAVHLIDAEPVVLAGVVRRCEYDTESMYDLEIELEPTPARPLLDEIRARVLGGVAA